MLTTIARECRLSLECAECRAFSSAPPTAPDGEEPYESQSRLFAGIHGKMTLDQLAATTGMSLDQVLNLIERFVLMASSHCVRQRGDLCAIIWARAA